MNVLIVGGGYMGNALRGCWTHHHVLTVDPAQKTCLSSVNELPSDFCPDIIVLAVKPQVMAEALPPYIAAFGNNNCIWVSVAAGLSIAFYEEFAPNACFVRCMPNMPIRYQAGAIGLFSKQKAKVESLINALFENAGQIIWVNDELSMNIVTAISGSGPAYFYLMVEALTNAGIEHGLSATDAAVIARQTLIGAGEVLKHAAYEETATLRAHVTSPGGTTAAALDVFMRNNGLESLVKEAVSAANMRAVELGQ